MIAVADSGRGLTEDDLTRLFNRFTQAHPKVNLSFPQRVRYTDFQHHSD